MARSACAEFPGGESTRCRLPRWRRRVDATPAILAEWVSHQHYDAYWQRGSIAVDYKNIKCPVYVVDGWIDTYSNVIGRLLEHLSVPRKGLIGSWGHNYPDAVNPGPGLDWAYEEIRWWQQWLLGIDTGISVAVPAAGAHRMAFEPRGQAVATGRQARIGALCR